MIVEEDHLRLDIATRLGAEIFGMSGEFRQVDSLLAYRSSHQHVCLAAGYRLDGGIDRRQCTATRPLGGRAGSDSGIGKIEMHHIQTVILHLL